MARITVNETGTYPVLVLTVDIANASSLANGNIGGNLLSVTCLQDITVTNGTGIFSWTDFCSGAINKVTTPSDNEISTNIVIDGQGWFGNANATANTSAFYGVSGLSQNKIEVSWRVQLNDSTVDANVGNLNGYFYCGTGYVSSLAPTVSPDAPVWVSPLTIAVNGDMYGGEF
jgi:hypothetical protein